MFDRPENIYQKQKADRALADLKDVYPQHYCGDGMFVANRNMHFYEDPQFRHCMDKLATGEPYTGMAWRAHTLIWCISQVMNIPGAIMEFGTFRGFKMKFMMEYFQERLAQRDIYLFDTFEGIDPNQAADSPISPDEHQKAQLYAYVLDRFKAYANVQIIKGAAPHTLADLSLDEVAFIHLDMNSWMAEIGTLEKLWHKIQPGGIVLLDDFGFFAHRAQKDKELAWFKDKGYAPLELPTGQAMVIKHV